MKLGLLWVGPTRDGNIKVAIARYLDRIGRYLPILVTEVREEKSVDRHSRAEALARESRSLREKVPRGHEMVLLDLAGREMTSEELAGFLQEKMNRSTQGLTFVVGGHLGVDEETKHVAEHTIALSRMTLPHDMARLVIVEQLYRALSIIHGGRYHR